MGLGGYSDPRQRWNGWVNPAYLDRFGVGNTLECAFVLLSRMRENGLFGPRLVDHDL